MQCNGALDHDGLRPMTKIQFALYDLFSGIQGEATWTGRAMLFLRFSGCPLSCSWCDEPLHKDPQLAQSLTAKEILAKLRHTDPNLSQLLLTGGEPLAVKEIAHLVHFLKNQGYWIAMETSGMGGPVPVGLDWLTLSPKTPLPEELYTMADEIKYIVGASPVAQQTLEIQQRAKIHANVWVQPQSLITTISRPEVPTTERQPSSSRPYLWRDNVLLNQAALEHCLEHIKRSAGKIRLSLQTHKLINLP